MKWKDLTVEQASDLIIELHDLFYRPESPTWKRWTEDNWGYPQGLQVLWATTAGSAMLSMGNACAAPCNICGALHQYYIPVPALPGMNMTERAARAEALAERLAAAFANCPGGSHESMREQQAALDAWTAHRAALEKSAGEGA